MLTVHLPGNAMSTQSVVCHQQSVFVLSSLIDIARAFDVESVLYSVSTTTLNVSDCLIINAEEDRPEAARCSPGTIGFIML